MSDPKRNESYERKTKVHVHTNGVPDQMLLFHQFKNDLDKQLLNSSISKYEMLNKLTQNYRKQ